MKIAVFSDIHGNIFAFNEVIKEIKKETCDLILYLGDTCGYYYFQNEIIDVLRDIPNLISLKGNHDDLFIKSLTDNEILSKYSNKYGKSFEFLKDTILSENLYFLKVLNGKYIFEDNNIAAFHGSPFNNLEEYVYPDSNLKRYNALPYDTIFLGHTHYVMDREYNGKRILNPGSCGQPRDGGAPSYAIFFTETNKFLVKRVSYDVSLMEKEILKRKDTNPYLIDALYKIK